MTIMSRRRMLARTTAGFAAAAAVGAGERLLAEIASQPSTPVRFAVPDGACDCHTHVFGDPQRFPFAAGRTYTPEPASVAEMQALHRALHTTRVVVVQPSVYGTDNACTLDALKQLGPDARGIAVIDEGTPDAVLDDMEGQGIRGIRINMATARQTDPDVGRRRFDAAVARMRNRKWHIQIYTQLSVIQAMQKELAASPVPVVFDHFGGAQAALGMRQSGFDVLLDLVRSGQAYVKLSAPYRGSMKPPDYGDIAPLAKAFVTANINRVLWGTDWPHPDTSQGPGRKPTDISPLRQVDDGRVFNQFSRWVVSAAERRTILVDNPQRLYGFGTASR
jgi:predicted TIM-barrel fold metal-dependent hydrolase